jgi:hypothetical protein
MEIVLSLALAGVPHNLVRMVCLAVRLALPKEPDPLPWFDLWLPTEVPAPPW